MQQNHVRSNQTCKNVELQPGGHSPPLYASASFAKTVKRLGHEHKNKSNDPYPMTNQFTGRWNFTREKNNQTIQPRDQDHCQKCKPEFFVATKHKPPSWNFANNSKSFCFSLPTCPKFSNHVTYFCVRLEQLFADRGNIHISRDNFLKWE